jgi:chemotaxis protein methyltransferase CheR
LEHDVHASKPSLHAAHSKRPNTRRSLRPVAPWDDALSDKHYEQLSALIQRRLGFHMPSSKRALLHGRIVRRARALHCRSLSAYCESVLQGGDGGPELTHFLDLVTTNVTSFFREPAQLERVQEFLVLWAKDCRDTGRDLRVWSAACSRGHEVWTLAMMLAELPGSPRFSLLGSDVSSQVLKQAIDAVYPEAELANVPAPWRKRYFMHSRDRSARLARVVPELRQTAQFKRQNLIDPALDAPRDFDLVLLRNVLIYFDAPTQRAIVSKVARHIRPEGLLCVGLAESLHGHRIGFEHLELGMYQRGTP